MAFALLIPAFLLVALFVVATSCTRRNRAHPAFWLVLLYLGSCVAALFVNQSILEQRGIHLGDDAWVSLTGYAITIVAFLLPSFALRNQIVRRVNVRLLERIVLLTGPLVLFAAAYQIPIAWTGVSTGADVVRTDLNVHGVGLLPESPLTTVAVVISQFYFLYALVFVLSTITGGRRSVRVVAFVGSTLYLINSFCFAARDGILWFFVAYLWALWFAKPLASAESIARVRRLVLPVAATGTIVFGLFSVQRFADRSDGHLGDYLLLYYGSQPYVFAADVDQQRVFYGGKLRFPLFLALMGDDVKVDRGSPYEWSFGTFVKDIYAEGGWVPMLFTAIAVPFVLILALYKTSGRFPEAYTLIGMAYVQFMAQGVFYLRLGNRAGNLYLACIAALALGMLIVRVRSHTLVWR